MSANDEVTVIVYDVFTVGDMVSATSGGTFVGNITHNGTVTFGSTVSGLDVNGTEIILDADGDTTITADTDDQIDIKIAGADDFQFTANTFTAQSGSTIAAQALTATTITATGDISFDGGDFVFNESGAAKDFRIEGDTFSNLFIVDGSEDDIGMGLTPSFTSGNGVHLADDFKIGFGAGGNSRPDFQLGYSSSADRLHLACGYGADDADVQFTTGGQIGLGTVGGGAISHNIQIKDNAPEIMMEETGSGGSKRISMGVTSGGQPFIGAEQSGGNLNIDLVGTTKWNINQYGTITQSGNNSGSLIYEMNNSNGSNPYGCRINFTGADVDNNTTYFLAGEASSNNKFKIFSDGDVANHDNSYGSLSDERIKQDITDANSQWDDIKAVKVRNFKKKDDVEKYGNKAWSQIGVIAQELEKVSPKLIKETPPEPSDVKHNSEFGTLYEDGDTIPEGKKVGDVKEIKSNVKKVSYSILYMKAVKALQEAMTRIETLEAKVKALEEA